MASNNAEHARKLKVENSQTPEQQRRKVSEERSQFVFIELEVAITFCKVALSTSDPDRRTRNMENAVRGHAAAMRFSQQAEDGFGHGRAFQEKLAQLKKLLHELGQDV